MHSKNIMSNCTCMNNFNANNINKVNCHSMALLSCHMLLITEQQVSMWLIKSKDLLLVCDLSIKPGKVF